jgi:hypothetical protein
MCTWRGCQQRITRRSGRIGLDRRHKAITPAVDRLDHPLGAPAIPHGPSRQHHDPFQGVLADKLLGPQEFE